jgi:hypothetical protein
MRWVDSWIIDRYMEPHSLRICIVLRIIVDVRGQIYYRGLIVAIENYIYAFAKEAAKPIPMSHRRGTFVCLEGTL